LEVKGLPHLIKRTGKFLLLDVQSVAPFARLLVLALLVIALEGFKGNPHQVAAKPKDAAYADIDIADLAIFERNVGNAAERVILTVDNLSIAQLVQGVVVLEFIAGKGLHFIQVARAGLLTVLMALARAGRRHAGMRALIFLVFAQLVTLAAVLHRTLAFATAALFP